MPHPDPTTSLRTDLRRGEYHDSIVLMELQLALAALPGVVDAAAVMATESNLELLERSSLLPSELPPTRPEDLLIAVRADLSENAEAALAKVDELLTRRRESVDAAYRPHTIEAALEQLPQARWVLVSVPGRHATAVARRALELERHVFLYSDNVPLEDELALKRDAARRGLLLMGPDCGTASIAGVGLGFANHTRPGAIGLVAASGTGLQAVASAIDASAERAAATQDAPDGRLGISHAIGTGGRDLDDRIGGSTARLALDLLGRDAATRVVVLLSKPASPGVTAALLAQARALEKPVVVCLQGALLPRTPVGNLFFAAGLGHAAEIATQLVLASDPRAGWAARRPPPCPPSGGRLLRALFSGGTLAYETLYRLRHLLPDLHSNLTVPGVAPVPSPATSVGHSVLDLGADEYTVGRLHPMIDPDPRCRRLRQEADDPEVAVLLLDLVLGYGAHPDPAAALAEEIERATTELGKRVVVLLVGTAGDPQGKDRQHERLENAGALVFEEVDRAVAATLEALPSPQSASTPEGADLEAGISPVAEALEPPFAAINVGLESFADSLGEQGARCVQLDWRPPAGGDERLQHILAALSPRRATA